MNAVLKKIKQIYAEKFIKPNKLEKAKSVHQQSIGQFFQEKSIK